MRHNNSRAKENRLAYQKQHHGIGIQLAYLQWKSKHPYISTNAGMLGLTAGITYFSLSLIFFKISGHSG